MKRLTLFCICLVPTLACAELEGQVVSVHDGDSLIVLAGDERVRVRLDSIDAPELKQPYGGRSRDSLAEMCSKKLARVEDLGRDRFGRTIGRVTCAGKDANAEQVRRGMAWVFVRYAPRPSPLYDLEGEAKAARRGLWADPNAMAPWEWRRTKGRSEVQ